MQNILHLDLNDAEKIFFAYIAKKGLMLVADGSHCISIVPRRRGLTQT